MEFFKVIIAGSRKFDDFDLLEEKCDYYLSNKGDNVEIVCGMAEGADMLGADYGISKGWFVERFPADWKNIEGKPEHLIKTNSRGEKYYVLAGHERNQKMAEYADALILFHYGTSGSLDMLERAKKEGLLIKEIKL